MKKSIKIVPSWFMLLGHIFAILMGYGILVFTYSYPYARNQLDTLSHIICIICAGILPTIILILAIPRGVFSVVTISERGVKRTLIFGCFKTEMSWDGMAEMRYYARLMPFIFFSKSSTLGGMTYERIIKKRDVIQVALSKKVYDAIRQNTEREIIDLPENFKIDK